MVLAGTRWLGIRLDLLSALLIGAVALFAALLSQDNAGKLMINKLPVPSKSQFICLQSTEAS